MRLTAILTPDELSDGTPMYMAQCPELDVTTQGETQKLALSNLNEAVALLLEDAELGEIKRRLQENTGRVSQLEIELPIAA